MKRGKKMLGVVTGAAGLFALANVLNSEDLVVKAHETQRADSDSLGRGERELPHGEFPEAEDMVDFQSDFDRHFDLVKRQIYLVGLDGLQVRCPNAADGLVMGIGSVNGVLPNPGELYFDASFDSEASFGLDFRSVDIAVNTAAGPEEISGWLLTTRFGGEVAITKIVSLGECEDNGRFFVTEAVMVRGQKAGLAGPAVEHCVDTFDDLLQDIGLAPMLETLSEHCLR